MYKCVFAIFPFLNLFPHVAQNVNIEKGKMVTNLAVHCMYWDSLCSSFQGKSNLEETFPILETSQPSWHLWNFPFTGIFQPTQYRRGDNKSRMNPIDVITMFVLGSVNKSCKDYHCHILFSGQLFDPFKLWRIPETNVRACVRVCVCVPERERERERVITLSGEKTSVLYDIMLMTSGYHSCSVVAQGNHATRTQTHGHCQM